MKEYLPLLGVCWLTSGLLAGCGQKSVAIREGDAPASDVTIQKIETMAFDEAYRQWLKEKESALQNQELNPSIVLWGSIDPQTDKFTPTTFFALTCRLGRDAHVHEAFLVEALSTNDWVSMILDASPRLCSHYGVESEAPVVFDSEIGYSMRPRSGLSMGPDGRRQIWLGALAKSNSQGGPANGNELEP